jgi:hypothetical protein
VCALCVCVCVLCVFLCGCKIVPSELENLERDWEMTVLPHPKAPGTATVPPYKHIAQKTRGRSITMLLMNRHHTTCD